MKKSLNLEELRHMIKSALLVEKLTAEAKKETKDTEEAKDTEETEDTEGATEETGNTEGGEEAGGDESVDNNIKAVQDGLNAVMTAAQKLGDEKLIDQIGNTITFFTRIHVSKSEKQPSEETPVAEDMMINENKKSDKSIFPLWSKIK